MTICRTPLGLALSLVLGSVAVSAAQSAPRRQHGSPKLVLRKARPANGTSGAGSSPTCDNPARGCPQVDVRYFGGPVIANPKVHAVFWTGAVDATTRSGIGPFFSALTDSPMMDWLAEYDTGIAIQAGGSAGQQGTGQRIGRGAFGGGYVITPKLNTTSLLDADIQAELDAQIAAGNLPESDANSVYMIYFPPGTAIDDGYGELSCQVFCAYHGTFARGPQGRSTYYAVLPDFGGPDTKGGDCSAGCGTGSAFQNLTSVSSHELLEAVTDPEVGLVSTFDRPLGWYDASQGEIGDMCNQQSDTLASPRGTFTVQQVYSRRTGLCQTSYVQPHDFAISLSPVKAKVMPGGAAASVPVVATNTAGETQPLALSLDASALPAGVTAALGEASIGSASGSTTLTFAATGAAAPAQDVVVAVTATGASGVVHTAAALLQVGPPKVVSTPTVALSGATAGALLRGTVKLVATGVAGEDGTLAAVSLRIDGALVATGSASASYLWDTTPLASRRPAITAVATDTDGASASTTVEVAVAGPPTADVTSPGPGSVVAGTVAVSASCAVAGGELDTLALAVDGVQVASGGLLTLAYAWDTAKAANGPHLLGARASDWYGAAGTSTPVVVVVKNPPRVVLGAPGAGAAVSGAVPVQATATAPAGTALSQVELRLDGQTVGVTAESPHVFSLDTALLSNGAHVLAAHATTQDGAAATSTPLSLSVSNDFTLAVGPASATASIGGAPAVFTVSTAAVAGAPLVALSASGAPAGVTVSFSPGTVRAGESARLVVDAPPGTAAVASTSLVVTGTSAGVPAGHSVTATLALGAQAVSHGGCSSAGGPGWELIALLGLAPLLTRPRARSAG